MFQVPDFLKDYFGYLGLRHHVAWEMGASILEEHAANIFYCEYAGIRYWYAYTRFKVQ